MKLENMKFVIVSPPQASGGSIVLHLLCKLLSDKGYDARIVRVGPHSLKNTSKLYFWWKYAWFQLEDKFKELTYRFFKNTDYVKNHKERFWWYAYYPVKGCKRKWLPFVDDDTIVVYPCIVWGNILGAKHVVRWIMGAEPHEFMDGVGGYENSDVFFCYREIFNVPELNPTQRTLNIVNFDFDLYKQTNYGERTGNCYIIRKGRDRSDLPKSYDGPVIDNFSEQEIVETFNQCKYCYSYDTQTYYSVIAAFCGCISIIIPEKGKSVLDYRSITEPPYGEAWGTEQAEIERAQKTVPLMKEKIYALETENEANVENFIHICHKLFGEDHKL